MALTDINYGCFVFTAEILETLVTLRLNKTISRQEFIDYFPATVDCEFIVDNIDLFPLQEKLLEPPLEPLLEITERIESRFEILDL